MTEDLSTRDSTAEPADTSGLERFGGGALLGWAALVCGAVPFLLLWLLVRRSWAPLSDLDQDVAASLNEVVSESPTLVSVLRVVTDLGGTGTAVFVMVLTTAFLLIRGQRRLAAFVAVTGLGLAVLGPTTKAIVDRARPVVADPVVEVPSNASFPSGHSMTALTVWGALVLVALPSVRRRARPWLVAGAVAIAVAVGLTRLALGVHFVTDVLAGWALGAGWLAVTVLAFRTWQHRLGRDPEEPLDPLEVPPAEAAHAVAGRDRVRHVGRTAASLTAVLAASFLVAAAVGLVVVEVLTDTWFGRWDRSVVRWFAEQRGAELGTVMDILGWFGGTRAVIAVGSALAVLGLAVAASWRPVVFVVVALVGEILLYAACTTVVDRSRPDVPDLTSGLPTAASWPSGHVMAAVVAYGAAAALVIAYGRGRWRWAVLALPLLMALAIGVSRIYVAAHHPSDVLAGLVLGAVWVAACARALLPAPGQGVRAGVVTGGTRR